ncbi:MAG: hypothetical protein ABEI75_01555 [Halobaculum sp.]
MASDSPAVGTTDTTASGVDRRHCLTALSAVGAAAVAGCSGRLSTDCTVSAELTATLPPAPEGFERSAVDRGSGASREAFGAREMVVAEYSDGDDETLDDYTVRAIRFEDGVDGRAVLREQLASVATDSGRSGVAVLIGNVGFLVLGPSSADARSLLVAVPALDASCVERGRVADPATEA